jgi:hypothetical protein
MIITVESVSGKAVDYDLAQQILIVGVVVFVGLLGFAFINSWKKR